ncbi:GIY-YIG nuclease family protein [Phenylobacterium sp.]|uniref:GIY-YIG nuclease family protein n=1 Tax=Phenylobacterium sp. TaxID=1871053 RepID=UPI001218F68F|nr:GIY-YIG nuclease family protein [Phenylobacterium sp.]THD62288.1 MAG: GIY-YIG nuclease family protein [Phenylobacterium sp.]
MDKQNRREAIRDYKERKVAQGIYAVRCAATGETWVGQSKNLGQQTNGLWFMLRGGGHPNKALQAAFAAHGAEAFAFDVLEIVETGDLSAYARNSKLKDRDAHWRAELGASKIVG